MRSAGSPTGPARPTCPLRTSSSQESTTARRIYTRVAHARARFAHRFRRRYGQLLAEIQTQVADVTEVVERTENAFRVTDDVYLARVYSAAMDVFRGRAWRAGVDRKLEIIRQTYAMLNAESQSARAEILEVAIVVLIDIVL